MKNKNPIAKDLRSSKYKKRVVHSYFKPRIKAIKLLQNRGGIVSNKSIAKYLDLYRNPIPYTKHQNIALKYYEEILKLISKDIKISIKRLIMHLEK